MATYHTVQQGSIGTRLEFTVTTGNAVLPLVGVETSLVIVKPDKTRLVKSVSLVSDGLDGKVYYLTQSGDLDTVGLYQLQVVVTATAPTMEVYPTNVETIKVLPSL